MKVIINNINIYYNNGHNNTINAGDGKRARPDVNDFCSHIVVNNGVVTDDSAFLESLKKRLTQSEQEVKEFLEKYSVKNQ
jgi:hypothetical protein